MRLFPMPPLPPPTARIRQVRARARAGRRASTAPEEGEAAIGAVWTRGIGAGGAAGLATAGEMRGVEAAGPAPGAVGGPGLCALPVRKGVTSSSNRTKARLCQGLLYH